MLIDSTQPQNTSTIPKHVAIIPDGNRRWAKERGLPSVEGHRRGADRLLEISEAAQDMGIQTLTVWGLSTENWLKRGESEREYLFRLCLQFLRKLLREARKRNIRFKHLGRKDRLPSMIINYLKKLEDTTSQQHGYQLNLALDYGGRDEILRAVRKVIDSGVKSAEVDEQVFSQYLDTGSSPDPDLIIRTSGEYRTSGLLPWQSDYAEYFFTPVYLPDFTADQFRQAVAEYGARQRRFGS